MPERVQSLCFLPPRRRRSWVALDYLLGLQPWSCRGGDAREHRHRPGRSAQGGEEPPQALAGRPTYQLPEGREVEEREM